MNEFKTLGTLNPFYGIQNFLRISLLRETEALSFSSSTRALINTTTLNTVDGSFFFKDYLNIKLN